MKCPIFIRKCIATASIMLMLVNTTAASTLHDLFGCHTATIEPNAKTGELSFAPQKFHCACLQPDYQLPYLHVSQDFVLPILACEQLQPATLKGLQPLRFIDAADLRGPPQPKFI